ncbi:hypothetical protein DPMN_094702 [Dreissena polymorpha]|uniref:Uncharacterized protein n=1 Tax=Dreissena polymorpha TaxID=45954 RepID=A0A9D4L5Z3_DREPO|nr:hypothetical protein DPMN_094702 [Dreissena polymorpha]
MTTEEDKNFFSSIQEEVDFSVAASANVVEEVVEVCVVIGGAVLEVEPINDVEDEADVSIFVAVGVEYVEEENVAVEHVLVDVDDEGSGCLKIIDEAVLVDVCGHVLGETVFTDVALMLPHLPQHPEVSVAASKFGQLLSLQPVK